MSLRPAETDSATKLATKNYFVERMGQEVERASRYPQQFSIVIVQPDQTDLTQEELTALARLIHTGVRSIDLVARLATATFGVLLPHTGRESAVLAERLVRTVGSRLSEGNRPTTVSVGFAAFPTDGRTSEELLSAAETAMGQAMREGGNRHLRAEARERSGGQAKPALGRS